eukprot:768326-Hanusia_phi.AAC.5
MRMAIRRLKSPEPVCVAVLRPVVHVGRSKLSLHRIVERNFDVASGSISTRTILVILALSLPIALAVHGVHVSESQLGLLRSQRPRRGPRGKQYRSRCAGQQHGDECRRPHKRQGKRPSPHDSLTSPVLLP